MKTRTVFLAAILILTSCSNLEISRISGPGKGTDNGIYYALPMTVLTVQAPVTKITLTPGACFCKDQELMRSKGKIINELIALRRITPKAWQGCDHLMEFDTSSYSYYKLGDISLLTYPVPDSTKVFFVTTRKNMLKKNSLTFVLNELSVLNSAEIKVEDRTLDVVTQVVGSVAEVAGKFMKGSDDKDTVSFCEKLKTELALLVKARVDLISNKNTQTSIETFNRQLEEIEKGQQAIISQFTYTEEKELTTVKIDRLVGPSQLNEWIDLFTFDKLAGLKILPARKDGYTNFYHNNGINSTAKPENSIYALRVETYGAQLPGYVGVTTAISGNNSGIAYNIPKKAAVKIAKLKATKVNDKKVNTVDKLLASGNFIMPQFGTVAFLKKNQSMASIEFDPFSGALRKVIVEKNALTADQIKNAGTALGGFSDVNKTELSTLQNEASLLEQKEKILKLKISIDSLAKTQD